MDKSLQQLFSEAKKLEAEKERLEGMSKIPKGTITQNEIRTAAYEAAVKEYESNKLVERSNWNYAKKKHPNLLQKYGLTNNKLGYHILPFKNLMEFEKNLATRRKQNRLNERNIRKKEEQRSNENFFTRELMGSLEDPTNIRGNNALGKPFTIPNIRPSKNLPETFRTRKSTTGSDPLDPTSRPSSPYGGKRRKTRKHKAHHHKKRTTRKH